MHSHARTSAKTDATLVLSRSLLCPNSFSGNRAAKFSKKMSAAKLQAPKSQASKSQKVFREPGYRIQRSIADGSLGIIRRLADQPVLFGRLPKALRILAARASLQSAGISSASGRRLQASSLCPSEALSARVNDPVYNYH
jgi:hypothetical protein